MKPFLLLRHAQAKNNVDFGLRHTVSDYNIDLTTLGRRQALTAGDVINAYHRERGGRIVFYVSPFRRTMQTCDLIATRLKGDFTVREELRLRETQHSYEKLPDDYNATAHTEREKRYAFFPSKTPCVIGETGGQVYDRVCSFYTDLRLDTQDDVLPVVITHGYPVRCFLTRISGANLLTHCAGFTHTAGTVDPNPLNAGIYEMIPLANRYRLL